MMARHFSVRVLGLLRRTRRVCVALLVSACVISIMALSSLVCYKAPRRASLPTRIPLQMDSLVSGCLAAVSGRELSLLDTYVHELARSDQRACRDAADQFGWLYELQVQTGEVVFPKGFEHKLRAWFGASDPRLDEAMRQQRILLLQNVLTREQLIFNPMRARRPMPRTGSDAEFTKDELKRSMAACDFCESAYRQNTAEDALGRMETTLSYTAANAFKYDGWHTLVASRKHDPLALSEAELVDMFQLAFHWARRVHQRHPRFKFPQIIWDAMPKSGASQVHTHLQMTLSDKGYYGSMETQRDAEAVYWTRHGRHFFQDVLHVHHALDLALVHNGTALLAYLTPKKDKEVLFLANEANHDMLRLLHRVIRLFLRDMAVFSFSMGMYLPSMDSHDGHRIPAICRLVFREPANQVRSDMSALELYMAPVIGIDRYLIMDLLRTALAS